MPILHLLSLILCVSCAVTSTWNPTDTIYGFSSSYSGGNNVVLRFSSPCVFRSVSVVWENGTAIEDAIATIERMPTPHHILNLTIPSAADHIHKKATWYLDASAGEHTGVVALDIAASRLVGSLNPITLLPSTSIAGHLRVNQTFSTEYKLVEASAHVDSSALRLKAETELGDSWTKTTFQRLPELANVVVSLCQLWNDTGTLLGSCNTVNGDEILVDRPSGTRGGAISVIVLIVVVIAVITFSLLERKRRAEEDAYDELLA